MSFGGSKEPKEQPPESNPPAQPNPPAEVDNRYKCGALQYTKASLFVLFGWLLWGDLCYVVFRRLGGTGGLGLYLQDSFKISNFKLYLIFSLVPLLIASIVDPIISFKSDRYRSRLGRRIPYILYTTPFLCIFAAATGFSEEIMEYFKVSLDPDSFISPVTAGMLLIGFLVAGLTFFGEFIGTVFYYLFADVVPVHFMGRFQALMRIVGFVAGFLMNKFLAGYTVTHMKWLHIGAAILYFLGLSLMCWKIKEGEYPPVTDVTEKTSRLDQIKIYFKECFYHRIYIALYISSAMFELTIAIGPSGVFGLHIGQYQSGVVAHAPATSDKARMNPDGTFVVPKAVAITPTGKLLVSSGDDGLLKLWEREGKNLKLLKTFPKELDVENRGSSHCVAITSDGKTALSGSSKGLIDVWDTTTGSRLQSLKAHEGEIRGIALSPDGTLLASASADQTIKIWNIANGTCINTLKGHTGSVNSVAFSSQADRLVSGGSDKKIVIWDVQKGTLLQTLEGSPGSVFSVCFAPALKKKHHEASRNVVNVVKDYLKDVFSNESLDEIAAVSCGVPTGNDLWVLSGGRENDDTSNKRDPNEQKSALRIWDISENKLPMVPKLLKGHKKAICSIVYKADIRMILSGSLDGSVRLWNPVDISEIAGDQSFKSISGYTSAVTSIACVTDGKTMINASDNGMLHVWDIDQGISLRKGGISSSFFQILALLLAYPMGAWVDRFNPIRVACWMSIIVVPFSPLSYFLFHDYLSGLWLHLSSTVFMGILTATAIPILITLLPKSKFGQMCSANAMVRQMIRLCIGMPLALFMDMLTESSLNTGNFRYAYILDGAAFFMYAVALWVVFYYWKKLGGDKYVPPEAPHSVTQ